MPRVTFVKSARKDNAVCKKGESYYWWKFRHGGKRYSLTTPKRGQLTQSDYLGQLYELFDDMEGRFEGPPDLDSVTRFSEAQDLIDSMASDFENVRDEIADEIEALGEEQQEKLDNMLEYFPGGNELLDERIEACSTMADAIRCVELDTGDIDPEDYWEDGELDETALTLDLVNIITEATCEVIGTEE